MKSDLSRKVRGSRMGLAQYWDTLNNLNSKTNEMAEVIKAIRGKMEGRGVNPAEAQMVSLRLGEVEDKLRQLGANKDNPIPF